MNSGSRRSWYGWYGEAAVWTSVRDGPCLVWAGAPLDRFFLGLTDCACNNKRLPASFSVRFLQCSRHMSSESECCQGEPEPRTVRPRLREQWACFMQREVVEDLASLESGGLSQSALSIEGSSCVALSSSSMHSSRTMPFASRLPAEAICVLLDRNPTRAPCTDKTVQASTDKAVQVVEQLAAPVKTTRLVAARLPRNSLL